MNRNLTSEGTAQLLVVLRHAFFPGRGYSGEDLEIRVMPVSTTANYSNAMGDAGIRMVRIIKLDPAAVEAAKPRVAG
jgi:hypothetical protein